MLDINTLISTATVLAAAATVIAVQILKSPLIPPQFQNHPVPTTLLVSLVADYIVLLQQHFSFTWSKWTDILAEFVVILVGAALTYTHVIANWPAAKSLEAPKTTTGATSAGN